MVFGWLFGSKSDPDDDEPTGSVDETLDDVEREAQYLKSDDHTKAYCNVHHQWYWTNTTEELKHFNCH